MVSESRGVANKAVEEEEDHPLMERREVENMRAVS